MAAAAEEDTVWIGFMDIVPVIGSVKEAVELVLAVYEGNKAVIKEKEKAVENIAKESLKKHLKLKHEKKLTLPDKPAAAAAEFSGLRNVKEVRKEMIIEHVKKGSKKGTKPLTPAQQNERQRKLKAINNDMLAKIQIINPNFNRELEVELKRSKRGEHVFNNDILRFHSKLLNDFIQNNNTDNLRGYNRQAMALLDRNTLEETTQTDIQKNMVAHFDEDEFYVNANALMYGEYCRALSGALLDVLRRINPGNVTEEQRRRVNFVIDNMNNLQIYVDQMAKVKWIANITNRLDQFEKVRQEVATMYNTDRGVNWCIRILEEIAPLFEQRP